MFKLIRKIVLRLVLAILIVVVLTVLAVNLPFDWFRKETSALDYSEWMGETLETDQKLIDIAMLGAHDAFTAEIGIGSPIDNQSAASIQTGWTGTLIKGFSVKQSKTQVSPVCGLLEAGVRYFDVRLTYHEEEAAWYTSHSLFSEAFAGILADLETFLAEHPGEFVILDIQHVNGIDLEDPAQSDPALAEIRQLLADSGVLSRAYPEGTNVLSEVTYGDLTSDGTASGVILFTKLPTDDPVFWSYGASIRSAWPDTDSPETAFAFLSEEADLIASGEALTGNQMAENPEALDSREAIRVMQAVLTMQLTGEGILGALRDWSLLSRARAFNPLLLDQEGFPDWLSAMPVVMVDYADSNHDDFLDDIMQIIIEKNQNP